MRIFAKTRVPQFLSKLRNATHHFSLRDVVEEDEVAEHRDEADEPQAGHNVDHSVLQGEFAWNIINPLYLSLKPTLNNKCSDVELKKMNIHFRVI